jgi:hypothetical protein
MSFRACIVAAAFAAVAAPAFAQQSCLHDTNESPEQAARRKQALQATRTVNNIQANQPGSPTAVYLKHEDLATSPVALRTAGYQAVHVPWRPVSG